MLSGCRRCCFGNEREEEEAEPVRGEQSCVAAAAFAGVVAGHGSGKAKQLLPWKKQQKSPLLASGGLQNQPEGYPLASLRTTTWTWESGAASVVAASVASVERAASMRMGEEDDEMTKVVLPVPRSREEEPQPQ